MWRHLALASGIVASMWAAAWLIGVVITAVAGGPFATIGGAMAARGALRVLSYSALAISGGTLAFVLVAVQILRWLVVSPGQARAAAGVVVLMLGCGREVPLRAVAQTPDEQQYRVALKRDPDDSKATFRLAQLLERRQPAEAERLYRRYITLEADDAWGYMALAEMLGRGSRFAEALPLYAEAVRRAPKERDAVCGEARMLARAGRTAQAIARFESWLASHDKDADAWRDLARERQRAGRLAGARDALERAARLAPDEKTTDRLETLHGLEAPAIEPSVGFSRDSDGNTRVRTSGAADFEAGDGVRVGLTAGWTNVSDGQATHGYSDVTVAANWRPQAGVQLDAAGGLVSARSTIPTMRLRLRATGAVSKHAIDVRFVRMLLDATPTLVQNRVVRSELQARPSISISEHVRLRGTVGAGAFQGGGETNSRKTFGVGAAWSVSPSVEVGGTYTQFGYAHASHAGYFAPKRLQSLDVGSYMEFERDTTLVALDVGGGLERLRQYGSPAGPWRPAFRAYALVSFTLRPGRSIRCEIDTYDTQAASVATPGPGWKYASVTASLHWALR